MLIKVHAASVDGRGDRARRPDCGAAGGVGSFATQFAANAGLDEVPAAFEGIGHGDGKTVIRRIDDATDRPHQVGSTATSATAMADG